MKKITITKALSAVDVGDENPKLTGFEIEGPEEMEASDGYHTFGELYEHRVTLFIALCRKINDKDEVDKSMRAFKEGFAFDYKGWIRKVWRTQDGSFNGWFILGIGKDAGEQITYHLPDALWNETDFAETLEHGPKWDGHTSQDVLKRLAQL